MCILRHGVDVVDIGEFSSTVLQEPAESIAAYFTSAEMQAATGENFSEHMAGWFAVKEAVLKALGFGFSNGLAFVDVEVVHNPLGAPNVILTGEAKKVADELKIKNWVISISHSHSVAFASAIALI